MIDETQQEQAALHALDSLSGAEATAFRDALATSPELQTFADEMADAAASLTHALPSAKAPAEILPRLLAQIRAERMHSTSPRTHPSARTIAPSSWHPWALAAGIAIGATLGFIAGVRIAVSKSQGEITALTSQISDAESLQKQLSTLNSTLKEERLILEKRVRDLKTRDAFAQLQIATLKSQVKTYANVIAVAVWDAGGQQGVVRFDNLPEPGAGKDYQMWIIDPRYPAPVSAGTFPVGSDGSSNVTFKPEQPIALADKFAVSVERKGGSATPQGPIVLISN